MDKHSPAPWRIDGQTIRDADGGVVMSALNPASMATRRLIVEAANGVDATLKLQRTLLGWSMERDRLRDLVRRLVHQFEGRATYADDAAIIRKAREAIGEDAP